MIPQKIAHPHGRMSHGWVSHRKALLEWVSQGRTPLRKNTLQEDSEEAEARGDRRFWGRSWEIRKDRKEGVKSSVQQGDSRRQ